MDEDSRIFIAGGTSLNGRSLYRMLIRRGYTNLVGAGTAEPDYTDQTALNRFFETQRPEYVFVVGGESGGIKRNQEYPSTLMIDNLLLVTHVIEAAHTFKVKKLLFLASSCIYPKHSPQPMKPEYIGSDHLEPTNIAYATAKIAGMRLCQSYQQEHGNDFIVAIPANDFGPGDDFRPDEAHVIGALMRRMHEAKEANKPQVEIWGTGKPKRQFIYTDDVADGLIFLMKNYDDAAPVNLGSNVDVSIAELAETIKEIVGYSGKLVYNTARPDGMPYKALDTSVINRLGWLAATPFPQALRVTYDWFLETHNGGDRNA